MAAWQHASRSTEGEIRGTDGARTADRTGDRCA